MIETVKPSGSARIADLLQGFHVACLGMLCTKHVTASAMLLSFVAITVSSAHLQHSEKSAPAEQSEPAWQHPAHV